jgi:glycosyltransferase involved in cell wall biosynthesis
MSFSVLISVYHKENPLFFKIALDSVLNQTVLPDEIVLVKDGPLTTELDVVINQFSTIFPNLFKIISLPENKGLGNALAIGMLKCSNEIVARMDTDDICVKYRFEKQLKVLKTSDYDLVASNIEEFNISPGDLKRYRKMPVNGVKLLKFSKFRNPVNHPTVMFKKSKVLEAGNYKSDILLFEDYSLFIRMLANGAKFYNIQENLLFFRIGSGLDVIRRRSGLHYIKNEWKFSLFAFNIGHISLFEWMFYVVAKLPIRLLPSNFILFLYNKLLRK